MEKQENSKEDKVSDLIDNSSMLDKDKNEVVIKLKSENKDKTIVKERKMADKHLNAEIPQNSEKVDVNKLEGQIADITDK